MPQQEEQLAQVAWKAYEDLELREPRTWAQLIAKFRGPDLAMVCVVAVAVIFRKIEWVPAAAFIALVILGLAARKREGDGSSSAHPVEDKTKPRYVRGDQATA